MAKIHRLRPIRPQTFTAAEQVVEWLSRKIMADPKGYKYIGEKVGVSSSTIAKIATRDTRWPRPTTLFPLLHYYGATLRIDE